MSVKYSCIALGNTWLALYFAALCRAVRRLKAVVLCLRYVDNVALGAWFVPSWCAQKKSRFKNKNFVIVFLGGHMASGVDDTASFNSASLRRAPLQQSCSPRGWYSPVPWRGLRRAPVSRTSHAHTNTHAHASCCCCYSVSVLRLVVALLLLMPSLVLSALVPKIR